VPKIDMALLIYYPQGILWVAPKPPRLYGLPKIYKEGIPLRPIVSTIDSPTYAIAKYIARVLHPFTGQSETYVKNSYHFTEIIKTIQLGPENMMISFDVESLFTNVPVDDAMEIIKTFTEEDSQKTSRS
jgi:hypothetical protein